MDEGGVATKSGSTTEFGSHTSQTGKLQSQRITRARPCMAREEDQKEKKERKRRKR